MSKSKTLGNCQICGREQAVLKSGRMSKHGYTVAHGWFNGVCTGEHFEPVQVSRVALDGVCVEIEAEVAELTARADRLESGAEVLGVVTIQHRELVIHRGYRQRANVDYDVPAWVVPDEEFKRFTFVTITRLRNRARAGAGHVEFLRNLADRRHGEALKTEAKPVAAAPIRAGENRVFESGAIVTATRQDGARVYWTSTTGDRGWTGTRAWRAMKTPD